MRGMVPFTLVATVALAIRPGGGHHFVPSRGGGGRLYMATIYIVIVPLKRYKQLATHVNAYKTETAQKNCTTSRQLKS